MNIVYEATPNPNSLKFHAGYQIASETVFFQNQREAKRSPLAEKLFGFPWAQAIMIGPDFITVTKQDWVDWKIIADPLADLISEHLQSGEGVLIPAHELEADAAMLANDAGINADDSQVVKLIKEILNQEIRPAVAQDGGDIAFHKYEENKLYVHLKGACSGCPSSIYTLKDGIEVRLKSAIPDLIEVIAI